MSWLNEFDDRLAALEATLTEETSPAPVSGVPDGV